MGSTKASEGGLKESAGTPDPPFPLRTGLVAGLFPVTTGFALDIGRTEGLEIRFMIGRILTNTLLKFYQNTQ